MRRLKVVLTMMSTLFLVNCNYLDVKAEKPSSAENSIIYVEEKPETFPEGKDIYQAVPPLEGTQVVSVDIEEAESDNEDLPRTEEGLGNNTEEISIGEQVVAYASQFIGNPYVYGGTSLTEGADCSGFVMRVYEQFGISLPRTSKEQGKAGTDVGGLDNAHPGDIVSYKGHIGIYDGKNQLVHASNPKNGIMVSPVNYKPILSVRCIV